MQQVLVHSDSLSWGIVPLARCVRFHVDMFAGRR
jgi:hypothetical protein